MRLLWPALTIALLTFGALLLPLAAAKLEQPEPTIGDFWEMRAVTPDGSAAPTSRNTVTAFETVTIEGTSYEAVRTESFGNQSSGEGVGLTTSSHIVSWTRRSDGAALRTRSTFSYSGLGIPASETTSETTYLQPCRHVAYPFDVGDEWTVSCTSRSSTSAPFPGQAAPPDTTVNESYRIRALRAERVTVPAGTFDAVVLEFNSTSEGSTYTYYQWYAPSACSYVKGTSDSAGQQLTSELVAFRCAKGAGASTIGSGSTSPTTTTSATPTGTPGATPATPTAPGGGVVTSPAPTGTSATPAGATPAGNTSGSGGVDSPGPGLVAILVAGAAAALVLRRKAS